MKTMVEAHHEWRSGYPYRTRPVRISVQKCADISTKLPWVVAESVHAQKRVKKNIETSAHLYRSITPRPRNRDELTRKYERR